MSALTQTPAVVEILRAVQEPLPDEPDMAFAAQLYRALMGAGVVERLDVLHRVLVAVHRGGRSAERHEVLQLAEQARDGFAAAIAARRGQQLDVTTGPWGSPQ